MELNVNDNYIVQSANYLNGIDAQRIPGASLANIDGTRMTSASQMLKHANRYSGPVASFEAEKGVKLQSLIANITAGQEGGGDPAPDNVRPIHGWDGINIYNDPKYGGLVAYNQLVENGNFADASSWSWTTSTISGAVSSNVMTLTSINVGNAQNIYSARQIAFVPGHKVLFSFDANPSTNNTISAGLAINAFGSFLLGDVTPIANSWNRFSFIANTNDACNGIRLGYKVANTLPVGETLSLRNINCFDLTQMFGSDVADTVYRMELDDPGSGVAWVRDLLPADYYPYNAGEVTCISAINGWPYDLKAVSWSDSAGTVYGGTINLVSGLLTVTHKGVDMGTLSWIAGSSGGVNYFYALVSDIKQATGDGRKNLKSSMFTPTDTVTASMSTTLHDDNTMVIGSASDRVVIRDDSQADSAAFTAAVNGQTLVYELANPLVYDVGPIAIYTLEGINNIFADTGEIADAVVPFYPLEHIWQILY